MSSLSFLYKTGFGRILLKPLVCKSISSFAGWLLDRKASKVLIRSFVKKNSIKLDEYYLEDIHCFNDFFCRKIKEELRPISMEKRSLIAPCDGLLSAYSIEKDTVISAKQSHFTISSLLKDEALAKDFEGGLALVFRLCVNHYHRYIYFDSGSVCQTKTIPGIYHTVRPIALEEYPVFIENSRAYSLLNTENFGKAVQMEVGALLVGKIVNEKVENNQFIRGQEKGHFEYGGSTVIILLPSNTVIVRENIQSLLNTNQEIPVLMGEVIGYQNKNRKE